MPSTAGRRAWTLRAGSDEEVLISRLPGVDASNRQAKAEAVFCWSGKEVGPWDSKSSSLRYRRPGPSR